MSDYSVLAQRVSLSIAGVRGCLMLSRDGMVLGAHPEGESESRIRSAWVRFAGVGDPERSYVEFPDQIWAFVRRGSYAAFAVADVGVRPGVLVDLLEQALLAGEHDRARDRETLRLPEAPWAPSGKPRTSLHKPERPSPVEPDPVTIASEPTTPASAEVVNPVPTPQAPAAGTPGISEPDPGAPEREPLARLEAERLVASPSGPEEPEEGPEEGPEAEEGPEEGPEAEEGPDEGPEEGPGAEQGPGAEEGPGEDEDKEDESEVDRILLAKEFAGLLQVPKEDDEASR